jgi:hypothetical protein
LLIPLFKIKKKENELQISCANTELPFKMKKKKRAAELVVIPNLLFKMKKKNQTAELVVANTKLVFKISKKEKQAAN